MTNYKTFNTDKFADAEVLLDKHEREELLNAVKSYEGKYPDAFKEFVACDIMLQHMGKDILNNEEFANAFNEEETLSGLAEVLAGIAPNLKTDKEELRSWLGGFSSHLESYLKTRQDVDYKP
jgi:hypothetical protein